MIASLISAYCALPNFPGKQRTLRMLPKFEMARSYYGPRMVANVYDSTYRACMVGAYGNFISDFIAAQTESFTFVDIGANQGVFALSAVRNPACAKAIAFEPNPEIYGYLARNIEINHAGAKVLAINAAIADAESVELRVPEGHSGAASMFGLGRAITVPALGAERLRKMISGRVIAKIDVEGAEKIVLSALDRAGVLDDIAAIIVEISQNIRGADHESRLEEFLASKGWVEESRSGSDRHYDAVFVKAG